MKKVGIFIVLALIGGGVWVYFKKPELIEDLKDKVEDVIAGTGWRELKDYRSDFDDAELTEGEEVNGFVRDFKDEMTSLKFTDEKGGKLTLVHLSSMPQAFFLEFDSKSKEGVAAYANILWGQFFEGDANFTASGTQKSEVADAKWSHNGGVVKFEILQKNIDRLPPPEEMPQDVQDAIAAVEVIIKEKVELETEYDKLYSEKHHCFDKERFEEIEKRIEVIKTRAAQLTEEYKNHKAKIPHAHILKMKSVLERDPAE